MNYTHVIAFVVGAITHTLFGIMFQWLESKRAIRDARELRRKLDDVNFF